MEKAFMKKYLTAGLMAVALAAAFPTANAAWRSLTCCSYDTLLRREDSTNSAKRASRLSKDTVWDCLHAGLLVIFMRSSP